MKIPWAALSSYRRQRLIEFLLRDGEDFEEGQEERNDYCAAAVALRSLPRIDEPSHGDGPALDERQLLTRAELPKWVVFPENDPFTESYFYATSPRRIVQVVFGFGDFGASVMSKIVHQEDAAPTEMVAGEIPGCVLVAAGVDQIRRARRST